MRVTFLNAAGEGFADTLNVAEGTTAAQLFVDQVGNACSKDYTIRVNSQTVVAEAVLHDGDRVTVTPKNVKGA